jgi:lipoprotein-anchoring transpeptidase ErfK/SrfK
MAFINLTSGKRIGFLAGALLLCAPTQLALAREPVRFDGFAPGTIVVSNAERSLYFVDGPGRAIRYRVAVGKPGKAWRGRAYIDGKYIEPSWSPPAEVKRDRPWLPDVIPPGPKNPMGARALTLNGGAYAIHGTTRQMRASIGTAASYGCIRMYNEDVIDLFERVRVGTPVVVVP